MSTALPFPDPDPAEYPSRRDRRRREMVCVATNLFASLGYSACEMERVAMELGVAKGTLYLYFPGKQELFFACVDQGMQCLQQALTRAMEGIDDPFERIARSVWTFLDFFDRYPQQIELLIQERAIFRDRKRPTFFEYRDSRRERWLTVYREMVAAGRLRDDVPVEQMIETVGNLLYGTMFTNYFEGRLVPLRDQYSALLKIMFEGTLSDAERARQSKSNWEIPPAELIGESPTSAHAS